MKKLRNIILVFTALTVLYSCKKDLQTDFKDFFHGHEIIYTGQVGNVIVQPGNLEIGLKWKTGVDPTITGYKIYYNNGADSQILKVTTRLDTVRTIVKGLSEYTYSFTIYSFDAQGNRSVPTTVNNARAYGPVFKAGLVNRSYNSENPYSSNDDGSVTLNFEKEDTIIINTKTVISYTSNSGAAKNAVLLAKDSAITIKDLKRTAPVTYLSYYIPERNAIDTFAVNAPDVFPQIVTHEVVCNKSLFKEVDLPNDVQATSSGSAMKILWDGSVGPQAPPNVFFTDADHPMPNHFTFDMGKIYYNLTRIEETGSVIPPLNPTDFEVWGIADISKASTTLPGNDPGWPAEAKAKGWVLLKECVRNDDGQKAMSFNLTANPPPVRYIMIRVVKDVAQNSSVISELTFWDIE